MSIMLPSQRRQHDSEAPPLNRWRNRLAVSVILMQRKAGSIPVFSVPENATSEFRSPQEKICRGNLPLFRGHHSIL
jgi:hypothetical protein